MKMAYILAKLSIFVSWTNKVNENNTEVADEPIDYANVQQIMQQQSQSMQMFSSQNKLPSDLFIQRSPKETARLLYDLVSKSDRKYRHHTYTNCWIGRDAISVMMEHNLCLHRKHGVELCRQMEEMNLIHHVLYENGGKFGDNKQSYYQFTIDDQTTNSNNRRLTDLDVAFGLIHKVKTSDLLNYTKKNKEKKLVLDQYLQTDDNGVLPQFTKLPSFAIQDIDLADIREKKQRKRSTLTEFKKTQKKYVDLGNLKYGDLCIIN